ncbi:MAG: hypothetical protein AOA66_0093 [Candidatus Bathyarchaeota archaeon BA2]|nr:MAG: hypothetical protein AOA66_0093 [Candidatus Bathyarchaeota archaeon BA2]
MPETEDLLPPVVVLHKCLPHVPTRIYGGSEIVAVISEMPRISVE